MFSMLRGEQRTAVRAFDFMVESTDVALGHPNVVAELGALAADLRYLNQTAFMPNVRDGRLSLPKRQRDTANIAVVPVTDEQFPSVQGILEPLQSFVRTRHASEAGFSRAYDLHLEDELEALFMEGPPEAPTDQPPVTDEEINTDTDAVTLVGSVEQDGYYHTTRPIIAVRASVVEEGEISVAGALGHEEVHAFDALRDGAVVQTRTYTVASELRAYHVSAAIYRQAVDPPLASEASFLVDSIRRQEIGDAHNPYKPTPELVDFLARHLM